MSLFEEILRNRGLLGENLEDFLNPKYDNLHDPYLLPDMDKAIDRLIRALKKKEKITIYGDYDIDGLTATSVLVDAFGSLGFEDVEVFIPNRFVEGYGLTVDAIESIAESGTNLIVTVDCGSLSHDPINRANDLGMDVIVTDHHNAADVQPNAVAVINPKRTGHQYPFKELAGVGVAFKLVTALQSEINGLDEGQEKWLLDLVALGTVCDVVPLVDENRILVHYGMQVLRKTRRPGIKALIDVARVDKNRLSTRDLGFALGPRMNAAGRLETAKHSLDLLLSTDYHAAHVLAEKLEIMNRERRAEQDKIFEEASKLAERDKSRVLVLSSKNWNHGIVGIVAAKLLEKYKKPTFVLQELDDIIKGSARSFGDFSAADAIRSAENIILKGGGHKLAAGVTLPIGKVDEFRDKVNVYYDSLYLKDQNQLLIPRGDAEVETLDEINIELIEKISDLEPFGKSNEKPVIKLINMKVKAKKNLGQDGKHIKLTVEDRNGLSIELIKFNGDKEFDRAPGTTIGVWTNIEINEWNNLKTIQGYMIDIE
jgi:single-stranded-DNA-specific exonuclease